MEFLHEEGKRKKIMRTVLYNDQEFSRWEFEIIHTPLFQRLYDLKQLGFADRVFPDAVHSRFNHVLGVTEMAQQMAESLKEWLDRNPDATFSFVKTNSDGITFSEKSQEIKASQMASDLKDRISVVRLVALLHDLTHAAYGHTLEDEVQVFEEKHDAPERQKRFFDALVAQLLYIWLIELRLEVPDPNVLENLRNLDVDASQALVWAGKLRDMLSLKNENHTLATLLRELELAMVLLTHIEFAHSKHETKAPAVGKLLVGDVAKTLDASVPAMPFDVHRDLYLIDMVGNTICADLLDYARRDALNAGLKVGFDTRLIRYLVVVTVDGELSPTNGKCIRLAIQFFTDKMRQDVLSEMSAVLKARYLINERVLFHPTKCAAGAMLGTVCQLLGLGDLPPWMQAIGDQEFLAVLKEVGVVISSWLDGDAQAAVGTSTWERLIGDFRCPSTLTMDVVKKSFARIFADIDPQSKVSQPVLDELRARIGGGRSVLWHLSARRFAKLAYRLRVGAHQAGGASAEMIARKYSQPAKRYELERKIEDLCGLPPGAIVVHCPGWRPALKAAKVLVVGSDPTAVRHLRDLTALGPETLLGLKPYEAEIRDIETMYESIWQFHAYVDPAWFVKQPFVALYLKEELGLSNDGLLVKELQNEAEADTPYALLATELSGKFGLDYLPEILKRVDAEPAHFRNRGDLKVRLSAIITEVQGGGGAQLPLLNDQ